MTRLLPLHPAEASTENPRIHITARVVPAPRERKANMLLGGQLLIVGHPHHARPVIILPDATLIAEQACLQITTGAIARNCRQ